jgi:hypothetical protein
MQIMNDQLEVALNTGLSKTSDNRLKLYDEMDEINNLINSYSYYKNSSKNGSFKEFMNSNNGHPPTTEELNLTVNDTLQGAKIQYFNKGNQNQPSMKSAIKITTQSDLIKRYIDAKDVFASDSTTQQMHEQT